VNRLGGGSNIGQEERERKRTQQNGSNRNRRLRSPPQAISETFMQCICSRGAQNPAFRLLPPITP
jgi:hypothetical protein